MRRILDYAVTSFLAIILLLPAKILGESGEHGQEDPGHMPSLIDLEDFEPGVAGSGQRIESPFKEIDDSWMESDEIEFERVRRWLGQATVVVWGGERRRLDDLSDEQRRTLWDRMDTEQRQQLSDHYGEMGAMVGPWRVRPREWGREMSQEIADWSSKQSGWKQAVQKRIDGFTPTEVGEFNKNLDSTLDRYGDRFSESGKTELSETRDELNELGAFIARLEADKSAIAVQSISKGLLQIIADYYAGHATRGAHHASEAVATVVGNIMSLYDEAMDEDELPTAVDLINALDEQIADLEKELESQLDKGNARLAEMVEEASLVDLTFMGDEADLPSPIAMEGPDPDVAGATARIEPPAQNKEDARMVAEEILSLDYRRQKQVLEELGQGVDSDIYTCLCRRGHPTAGTSARMSYHPEAHPDSAPGTTCGDAGAPCMRSGFGCSRHPLPTDPAIWAHCTGKDVDMEILHAVEAWSALR
ncbi:hypothetical protein LRB11_13410 [Ectothiorhodospira haloalkaliphila]|uniref:hypothetical protein n=1 Tax=Ectothiorhodospira haloalkaliphila TaxID=421628 RepID=UPI001EE8531D|nr:hypothetical protein [Ectothiorhodospira haloalkaliphila]MCG5525918.1 hypothetical protein [Ectothiorhodospira haloalkaliphila]